MTKLRSIVSLASFGLLATTLALAGCTIDGLDGDGISIGEGASVESCVEECRAIANQCGYEDTCEKACALIDDFGCLEESHDLYACKDDGADLCKAPQCMAEAEASLKCTHDASCAKDPTATGCAAE